MPFGPLLDSRLTSHSQLPNPKRSRLTLYQGRERAWHDEIDLLVSRLTPKRSRLTGAWHDDIKKQQQNDKKIRETALLYHEKKTMMKYDWYFSCAISNVYTNAFNLRNYFCSSLRAALREASNNRKAIDATRMTALPSQLIYHSKTLKKRMLATHNTICRGVPIFKKSVYL